MKLKELMDEWLTSILGSVKQRTMYNYKRIVELHILIRFEQVELRDVSGKDIQDFLLYLRTRGNIKNGQGLSGNMVASVLTVLKSALDYAVFNGYVNANPCVGVKKPKSVSKKVEAFSIEDQKLIEAVAIKSDKYFGIVLALYTGLRIGELLALKWEDVSFSKNLIKVTKTTFTTKTEQGKWIQVIDTPKTLASVREVPISSHIKKLLLSQKKNSNCEFIISYNDKQMNIRNYQQRFEYLLKKLNIEKKGFHALRHTFATRAIEMGVDIKVLSELLGHTKTSITLNRYVHTNFEQKKKAINMLSKNIGEILS